MSDTVDTSTISAQSLWIKSINKDGSLGNSVSLSYSYDDAYAPRTVYLSPTADLTVGAKYRMELRDTVVSAAG